MRIGQVVRNLLTNAAKYSPPGTPITLRTARHGRHVRIEVVDRGDGIHADDMPRIFEKFSRGRDLAGKSPLGWDSASICRDASCGPMGAT